MQFILLFRVIVVIFAESISIKFLYIQLTVTLYIPYTLYYMCKILGGMIMKHLPQISEAEYEVMKIVWAYAPISTNEITERLVRVSDWSPKTIQTLIKRLVNKGALSYEKEGRVFVYTPLVQEKEYVGEKSRSFLKRFYQGNITAMVSAFLENDALSEDEIDSLRDLLSRKQTGGQNLD